MRITYADTFFFFKHKTAYEVHISDWSSDVCSSDPPRILGAFNEKTPDWLAFYMFTYFTDRDGKFQLCALAESSFDPRARTTKFMLTEEAHHMFVGESGVSRVLQRTAEVMSELKTADPATLRAAGVIDLPTIQRYLKDRKSTRLNSSH